MSFQEMEHRFKMKKRAPARRIEIHVDRIEQLFNSMDPSPFPEKDLDHDAEEFIVSWAQEFPRKDPISLIIHVNQLPTQGDAQTVVEKAVHHYFAYRAKLKRLELRHLLKQGRTSLIIGLAFLGGCLLIVEIVRRRNVGALSALLRESLTIAGWVAMWRPMQIFLYEWWPVQRTRRLFERMSRMHIEVRKRTP
jgi:hypothetical protein